MASEIRILEDQLYEADYHNQVLIDQLERAKARVVVPDDQRGGPPVQSPRRQPSGDAVDAAPRRPDRDDPPPTLPARPLPVPEDRRDPPQVAIPPSADDLELPDVDLGEPVPPAGRSAPPEPPPGQIPLPDSVRRLYREEAAIPVAIRIHPGLSGGHRFDDVPEQTGMHLAIEAIDQHGKPAAIKDLLSGATLSVVLLDPQRDPADARLGQWDYSDDELRALFRPAPDSGTSGEVPERIHVSIPWNELRPTGTAVIAHIRLSTADTELKAEAELSTADAEVAGWNPRGGGLSR